MARMKPSRHQKVDPLKSSKKSLAPSSKPEESLQTSSLKQTQKTKRKEDLKRQIQDLGGDEDDYKLVEKVGSDSSDVERMEGKGKGQSSHNDVTLHRDIANFMKDLNFSKLKETARGKSNVKEKEKEKQDGKVHKPTKGSNTKVKATDSSLRDRNASSSQLDKNIIKEKATQPSIATKAEQTTTSRHIKFSQNEAEPRSYSGKTNARTLILTPSPHWYSTPSASSLRPTACPPVSLDYLVTCQTRAQSILDADAENYIASSAHASSASDAKFIGRVLSSGTLSDRLSALTLMVQASPLHNVRALETLKGMAGKKGREESLKALRAIVDWWIGGGAPDRKLKYFRDQQLTHPDATDAHLAIWFFEDWLKKYFFSILQLLENLVADPLPYVRKQAMHFIFQLLRDKPEQEQNLLRLLVHKLNDSEKSIASKASHYILQILQLHPQMKKIVVQEIAGFVLRPTISNAKPTSDKTNPQKSLAPSPSAHCRYYAAITFNQIVLTSAESSVADFLIDIYFGMFKEILGHAGDDEQNEDRDYRPKNRRGHIGQKKKSKSSRKPDGTFYTENVNAAESDQNAKLISAILTGINRALPFAGDIGNSTKFASHINTLFRITHASSTTFAVSLQSLMLLFHVCTSPKFMVSSTTSPGDAPLAGSMTSLPSRFFRTLYASLLDPRLPHSASSSKHASYLNLLLKAVKNDPDVQNKTVQASASGSQIKERKTGKRRTEANPSAEIIIPKRPSALTKRYLQTLISGTGSGGRNEVMCAGLFFVGELMEFVPGLTLLLDKVPSSRMQIQEISINKTRGGSNENSKKRSLNNSDEEEDHEDAGSASKKILRSVSPSGTNPKLPGSLDQPSVIYDPKKRDPQYANAEYAGLWELIPLQSHYHPSVSLHAHQLLTHSPVTATPDLGLNTLSHFLDRFVYKNAKKKTTQKGTSAMQRAGTENEAGARAETEVNTDQFRNMKQRDVPVDQVFFHNFFTLKHHREVAKGAKADKRKKKKSAESDADEIASAVSDDKEEQEIWKAMKKSIPELEISDDEDDADLDVDEDEYVDEDEEAGNENNDGPSDDEDGSALDFMEDLDDLISETGSLKQLVPWVSADASENEEKSETEWKGFDDGDGEPKGKGKKRDRDDGEDKKKKKRRTGLGTFASYDDYRDMIENAQEDDI